MPGKKKSFCRKLASHIGDAGGLKAELGEVHDGVVTTWKIQANKISQLDAANIITSTR